MTLRSFTSKLLRPVFGAEIVDVLRIGGGGVGEVFERLFGIAHGFRPGEGVQHVEALAEAVLEAHRQAVVVVVAGGIDPGDGAEGLVGPARLDAESAAGSVGSGLVVVANDRQAQTVIAVVGYFENGVFEDFTLDGDQPGLNVGPACVGQGCSRCSN